jgi:RNA polymerase-associated protein
MVTLYSDPQCPNSHRTRIVLAEKDLPIEIIEIDPKELPEYFSEINPYGTLPTVIDREVVFFESSVINEYLDERYPHPPLKPGSPATRAQMRLAVLRIETELYPLYFSLLRVKKKSEPIRKLRAYLDILDEYLAKEEFFIGEQYTLADVSMAPILWRLRPYNIDLAKWSNLKRYADRLFERPAFERALSEHEEMLHCSF